jgi:CheY-like chemotaxis protein
MTNSQAVRSCLLVVEDDHELCETWAAVLEGEGYHVATASNGQEALDYLRSAPPPGLILLDLIMPVMDGWEFRQQQQQDPVLADIPVLIVTGGRVPKHRRSMVDAAGYLLKPVDHRTLLDAVARYCR